METASSKPAVDKGNEELKDSGGSSISVTSNNVNPLVNPLVVQHLFEYFNLEDIKICRQVCRQWKTLARHYVQSLSKVKFTGSGETLRNFQSLVRTAEYLPSSNFAFRSKLNKDIVRFCKLFAHSITSINFFVMRESHSGSVVKNGEGLMDNFRQLLATDALSRLNELTLLSLCPEPIFTSSPPVLNKLLSGVTFPNMKKLSIVQLSNENMLALMKALPNLESIQISGSDWDFLLKSMEGINSTSRSKIRRIISLTGTLNSLRLQRLLNLNLNLTHLELSNETDEVEENEVPLLVFLLERLINQQRCTLKMFSVPQVKVNGYEDREQIIHFPCMKTLEELHVGYQIICWIDAFETCFPVLKKYNCTFSTQDFRSLQPVDRSPCLSLTHLVDLPALNHSVVHLSQLHEQFPNVTNLEICIRDTDVVRSLWTLWPGLKVLNLQFFSEFMPSAFTGLSQEECSEIQKNRTYDTVNLDDVNILPSIRNLKNLTSLILNDANTREREIKVDLILFAEEIPCSDIIVYLGISKLKQLRELDVADLKLSAKCVEDMIQSLPNLLPFLTRLEC